VGFNLQIELAFEDIRRADIIEDMREALPAEGGEQQ
jgi:hypothetical protein